MIFDAHFHIIDPGFPLVPNAGYLPESFVAEDYRRRTQGLEILGGAVVSGSFQAFDQGYLLAALAELGPSFVGVTQLPASVSDTEIRYLDAAGVRALRFNLARGGSAGIQDLERLARRVFDLAGWPIELDVDSTTLAELFPLLSRLPALSIDHLGLRQAGFSNLLRLVEQGAKVKASGFGRLDFDPLQAMRKIAELNPAALMFGTDLPSTRAPRPFDQGDVARIREHFPAQWLDGLLYRNALAFYRPRRLPKQPRGSLTDFQLDFSSGSYPNK